MGAGFGQVALLLLLTVVGLPLFFFGLMAALDRFERSLSARPRTASSAPTVPAAQAAVEPTPVSAAVVTLPVPPSAVPSDGVATAPAATATASTSKRAAAI